MFNHTFAITREPIKLIKMKKACLKITIGITCMVAAVCCLYMQDDRNVTDLVSSNIEALANEEGPMGGVLCLDSGSIDCYGDKVEMKVTNYSL